MMNVLALGLVLTSLVTAGFFTPSPEKQKPKEDVIVKEGHRVVVVEYEKDDGNTKVSISPQDSQAMHDKGFGADVKDKLSEKMEEVKEGMKEVSSSVLPDVGKVESEEVRFRPRELVCDAYGKCKHKIASALGKTKEAVVEKAHEAAEKVYEVEEEAKEDVTEAVGKVKETVTHAAHKASDKVQEAKENVKDSASEVSSKAKEKVGEKESEIKDDASRKMEGTKEMVSEKTKEAEERVENASDRAKKSAHKAKKEGQKELSEILHHAREVVVDVFYYVVPRGSVASLTGILHLMGFAAAYGMCVWITFASSHVLAGALPRQQFAMVQSKIYPVYFRAMGYSVGMALLGDLMSPRKRLSPTGVGMFQGLNLAASLGMILVNLMCLEPRATKVMLESMQKEKEEGMGKEGDATEPSRRAVDSTAETAGRGPTGMTTAVSRGTAQEKRGEAAANTQIIRLSQTLQRLNSYSSFLNVLTLVSLTWHLAHLGPRLHIVC